MSKQEEFIISEVVQRENIKAQRINNQKHEVVVNEGKENTQPIHQKNYGNKIECNQKSKSHSNEGNSSQKCVRIGQASAKNIQNKNHVHIHIHLEPPTSTHLKMCSMKALDDINQCSIQEIEMNVSQGEVLEAKSINLQKPCCKNIMKNSASKIKSYNQIGGQYNLKLEKSMNKSSKSIKFNDKKDVFTYKQEKEKGRQKQNRSKKKIMKLQDAQMNIPEHQEKQSQECCTVM